MFAVGLVVGLAVATAVFLVTLLRVGHGADDSKLIKPSPDHRYFIGFGWCDPEKAHHYEEFAMGFPTDVTEIRDGKRVWAK